MKYKAVAINETQNWAESFQKQAGKIYAVCIFNSEEVTNCCEVTPSYYLMPIYSYCEKEVPEAFMDQIAENDTKDGFYMHCNFIDSLKCVNAGDFDSDEDALEYCSCNVPL